MNSLKLGNKSSLDFKSGDFGGVDDLKWRTHPIKANPH